MGIPEDPVVNHCSRTHLPNLEQQKEDSNTVKIENSLTLCPRFTQHSRMLLEHAQKQTFNSIPMIQNICISRTSKRPTAHSD